MQNKTINLDFSLEAINLIIEGLNQLPTGKAGDFTFQLKAEVRKQLEDNQDESTAGTKG